MNNNFEKKDKEEDIMNDLNGISDDCKKEDESVFQNLILINFQLSGIQ